MRYLPILLLSAWLLPARAQTTYGTEHWLTFMENLNLQFNGPPSFHVVISSEVGTDGTVTIPATGFSIPFSVEAGTDEEVSLPTNIYYGSGDEALFNFGIRVNSELAGAGVCLSRTPLLQRSHARSSAVRFGNGSPGTGAYG
jgi:hypothetical protein